jgi:hypothetical protein
MKLYAWRCKVETTNYSGDTWKRFGEYHDAFERHVYVIAPDAAEAASLIGEACLSVERQGPAFVPPATTIASAKPRTGGGRKGK